jgi:hypothetical protein
MSSYIPETLRQQVIERARGFCEYCLIHQADSLYSHEIDHIILVKHRGETHENNLCLACLDCNRNKSSDFASFDPETGQVALLYNPRQQYWRTHFRLEGAVIAPQTPEGRVTVYVLKLNHPLRVRVRQALLNGGAYPSIP